MAGAPRDTPILIVGAGPTGLTAAIELSRRGYAPRIVDKGSGPPAESRALGINPRTLTILQPSGATERLLAAGRTIQGVTLHADGREFLRIEASDLGGPYPFILVLPQGEIEAILAEVLTGHGVEVERETELVSLEQDGERIAAYLSRPGGGAETVTPDILIGADGAHSRVREALGLDFPGGAFETDWGMADVRVRTDLDLARAHAFDLGETLFLMIPIRDDLVRLVCDHPDVLERAPPDIAWDEVEWLTTFRISHRQVRTYQKGKVFLAGDAAHIHSPMGARGMNLGIEDAAWLAWMIAEGDTGAYTRSRWPVGREVVALTGSATRLMAGDGRIARFLRRSVLPLLMRAGPVRRRVLRRMAGETTPLPPWLQER